MKKLFVVFGLFALLLAPLRADEGMWLPLLLKSLEGDMQSRGMKMSAEDIYSVNNSSLKDAVVVFGGGCTGEIISGEGLLLTNHHCGYGMIQSHSSVEKDYLSNGFWAKNRGEELQNPGLTATFIIRMEDVTAKVLDGIEEGLPAEQREQRIRQRIAALQNEATQGTHYNAFIRPFYYGMEFYLFVVETFRDVRLVGAPPESIGNFGKDTDNWVWPRHTGDFSLFRVYSGPDGKPADYSPNNIPLKPRHFLPISLKPKREGDFSMVFGFPGRTQQYLSSYAVDLVMNQDDPIRIELRDERLRIMEEEMLQSAKVRIQYSAKFNRISNYYKKWQGEVWGLNKTDALGKKRVYETEFLKRVKANPVWSDWSSLLDELAAANAALAPVWREQAYYSEGLLAVESLARARSLSDLEKALQEKNSSAVTAEVDKQRKSLDAYFKDYHAPLDRRTLAAMLRATTTALPREAWPEGLSALESRYKGDWDAFAEAAFAKSLLTDPARYRAFLDKPALKVLQKDPLYSLGVNTSRYYNQQIVPKYQELAGKVEALNRRYMEAQRAVFTEKAFYPDANGTLRVTYGNINGSQPRDGVWYRHYTTLDGAIAKFETGEADYYLTPRLKELHSRKDYGEYAQDGELWIAFVATNHTTGGNSGSPVIDGEGNLIGLNFDRSWESTMSDINYDVRVCRNISADIRYVLFVIDKYAGAGYLLNEMKLVR